MTPENKHDALTQGAASLPSLGAIGAYLLGVPVEKWAATAGLVFIMLQAVYMLPGYTHSITNLSDTDDLVTVMWANECFDPQHPDTFYEEV